MATTLALTNTVVNNVALFSYVRSVLALPCTILSFQLAVVIAGELNTKKTPVPIAADWKVIKNLKTYLRPDACYWLPYHHGRLVFSSQIYRLWDQSIMMDAFPPFISYSPHPHFHRPTP
jgi:hypothetical protein